MACMADTARCWRAMAGMLTGLGLWLGGRDGLGQSAPFPSDPPPPTSAPEPAPTVAPPPPPASPPPSAPPLAAPPPATTPPAPTPALAPPPPPPPVEPPLPPAPPADERFSVPFSVRIDPFNWILQGQLG